MDITIAYSFLPHLDADAALAFYRDTLGFELRNDVGYNGLRWLTLGPADQPGTALVLEPPGMDPNLTDDERATISGLIAKGSYSRVTLATPDLDGVFEKIKAAGYEVLQDPTDQPYGVRDAAFRDPSGNQVRFNEVK
ncbi:VOC family protein [Actinokineospora auranticolor]|uniref:Putative glyoxalase superfamily protein PhnB n=1 Tax=Actinokineospora auranticolor TaxID=155976 RepID=A0A2S6GNT0_9PSEU|nr:VOC family protein [Actinokineospora auranticolor]PPK66888.1 putative glyoxalase superfamily protein PhnB [Actinokineospora auranticolor]